MSWPDDSIEKLVLGERPTLLEAEKGNELIKALNVLAGISIEKGKEDAVLYSSDGVKITYGLGVSFTFTGDVTVLNPLNLREQFVLTFTKGTITAIVTEASEFDYKEITICEDGSPETYTFITYSGDIPP